MASQPVATPAPANPAVSIAPAVPTAKAPAAILAKREAIAPQPNPDAPAAPAAPAAPVAPVAAPAPPAPPLVNEQPAPPQPAPPANDPAPVAGPTGNALLDDPALQQFLQPAAEPAAQPPAEPAAQPAAPAAPAAATPESQPPAAPAVPAAEPITFDNLFGQPATPESQPPVQPAATPASQDNAELIALRDQVAALTSVVENRQGQGGVSYEISAEEREAYADSIPLVERIAAAHVGALRAELAAEFDALRSDVTNNIDTLQTGVTDFRKNSYAQNLQIQVPDIDSLTNNPSFQGYLNQIVPLTGGETVGLRLRDAHRNSDLAKVVTIMNEFRATLAGSTEVPAVPPIDSMAQPATTAAPAPPAPSAEPSQQMLPWSARVQASREYRAGRLTQEQFDRIDQGYRNAEAQGRVDYQS